MTPEQAFLSKVFHFIFPFPQGKTEYVQSSLFPIPFELNLCHLGDSLVLLKKIPSNSIDLIIADPPFAIDNGKPATGNYNRDSSKVLAGYQEVAVCDYAKFSLLWITECARILKKHGVFIIVSGWSNQLDILQALRATHLYIQNEIIFRYNFGLYTTKRFVSAHYDIFYCSKHPDQFTFNKALWYSEDVMESTVNLDDFNFQILEVKREYWRGKVRTPNKLPSELVEMLIFYGSNPSDLILDVFSGSGTVLKVARYMHRKCLAFDIVPEFVAFSNQQ
jgi:site-specific DNA-methyltransferase (adenine-specific)